MFRFFGRRKETKTEAVDLPSIVLRNKSAIETLEKRQQHLERRIAAQVEDAKSRTRNNDKRGAMIALKRKKMFEKELEQLLNAHLTLEQQIIALESAQTQKIAVGALSEGISAQKLLNQQLNLNKIDDLIEDMQEQSQLQSEIAQVLTSNSNALEDEELLAELAQYEAENIDDAFTEAGAVPNQIPGAMSDLNPAQTVSEPISRPQALLNNNHSLSTVSSAVAVESGIKISDEEQLKKLWREFS